MVDSLKQIGRKLQAAVFYGAIALGAMVPKLLVLAGGYTLVWWDTSKLFQPVRTLVVTALRDFRLPLWNPHEALGVPLLAQLMHGVLHPVSVLASFLCPESGLDMHILAYGALAAMGSAFLARTLGASLGAAAVAGLGYGLSGYILGTSSVITYLCAAATAPWAVAGMRLAGDSGQRLGVVATAAAIAFLHFAGDPQWTTIALLIGLMLATEKGGMRGLGRAVIGAAVGTTLAAIQILPALAYLGDTSRGAGLDMFDRLQWSLAPWRIVEFLVPGFFGGFQITLERWPVFIWLGGLARPGYEMPFIPSVYMGGSVLVLALAGVKRSRSGYLIGAAAMLLLWLSLGATSGAEQLLHNVPIWGKFRYAEKMVGPMTLCLSQLAAFGADSLSERPSRAWAFWISVTGVAAIMMLLVLSGWQGFDTMFPGNVALEAAPVLRHNLITGLMHAGFALIVLGGVIAAASHWPQLSNRVSFLAAGVVFLQMALAASTALHAGQRNVRDDSPLSALKRGMGPIRIVTPLQQHYRYPQNLDDFDAQIGIQSHLGEPCYNVAAGIDQLDTYTGLRPRRFELLLNSLHEHLGISALNSLRRFSTTHMIIKSPYNDMEREIARIATSGGSRVLENQEWEFAGWQIPHRSWATFAEKIIPASGEKDALDALISTIGKDDAAVILEGAPPLKSGGPGRVINFVRRDSWLSIDAVSANDGVLVVNDSFWPGWRATIDGRDVPIWRADFLVRAVPWPAGRHLLEMSYEPPEVRMGAIVSVAGAVAFIILMAMGLRRPARNIQPFQ